MKRGIAALVSALLVGAASPAAAKCTLGRYAELKVTMQGPRPMVTLGVNGKPAAFMVDSGAFWSVISKAGAERLGLPLEPAPYGFFLKGIGGQVDVQLATVRDLTIEGTTVHKMQFLVGGGESAGAGVLGQNVLHLGDVEYDLGHGAVRLIKATDCGGKALAYWAGSTPFAIVATEQSSPAQPHTIGTILINGQRVRATFDTGAPTSIVSLTTAARLGVRPGDPGVEPAGYGGGIGRRVAPTWIARFASFGMDGEEIRNIRMRIGTLSDDLDMLIGADFFLAHRIYVANGQHRMYLTYNGGPVFDLSVRHDAPAAPAAPVSGSVAAGSDDAPTFSRTGGARAARHDYAGAVDDFTHAIALAPKEPLYLLQRAQAYRALERPALARADLDAALALKPDDVATRIASAEMYVAHEAPKRARIDLDAAAAAMSPADDAQFELGDLYHAIGLPDEAVAHFGAWIDRHRVDSRLPVALNGRCWARATAGRELDKALADCSESLRRRPRQADVLDSRALVRLRMGDLAGARTDYDAALKIVPQLAGSLYGRGIVAIRQGQSETGRKDIAAALAIDPKVKARMSGYGVTP